MAVAVLLPKQGQIERCIISAWKKQPGEQILHGETLCEVETDKALVEVSSPADGILLAYFFPAGAEVPVMTVIAAVGQAGEDISYLQPKESPFSLRQTQEMRPAASPAADSGDKLISARVRALAERRGVDITQVQGTGPRGRIVERDIETALRRKLRLTPLAQSLVNSGVYLTPESGSDESGRITVNNLHPVQDNRQAVPPLSQPLEDEVESIPITGMRKLIAERMLHSAQSSAQFTLSAFADARALMNYRAKLKDSRESLSLRKITINDLILFAVSRTLPYYPELNALFENETIYQHSRVHLGFAVDSPRGLVVPVIRNADTLALRDLSAEAARLAQACIDSKIQAEELAGGTFTVSNLGSFGIETMTPVLNPPQVGILGVGSIHLRPVEENGQVVFIQHLCLSLTGNHQVIDGAPAARFLQTLARNIANIELLLAI
ncbi:MAG: 2-oxo acid dehydrogenase subunit E2 [Chloroflexi bacterium]|nr:2-oxo acid dehydrogenase subunit E2 [Chloroflexota bacterium]